jgi:hypothetical protein
MRKIQHGEFDGKRYLWKTRDGMLGQRYLMLLGRTGDRVLGMEGWDVGREKEKTCCHGFFLMGVRSPRRIG